MYPEQKNKEISWEPTASLPMLKKRADIIDTVRRFFKERHVLEVETPILSHAAATDPHVLSIEAIFKEHGSESLQTLYLNTSPEYPMKRLLSKGSGPIYQISKVFRQGDLGALHNPEFTLLEWYRPQFDHHALMKEVDELLQTVLQTEPSEYLSYQDAFQKLAGINPHRACVDELIECAKEHDIDYVSQGDIKNPTIWLHLLLTHVIEPKIGRIRPVFLYDFPANQAALAKIRYQENPPVASRFEVYFQGIELANGFHELQDAAEQQKRFLDDLEYRSVHGLPRVPIDQRLLMALQSGLPDCAGVALGVDRLILLKTKAKSISEVMSFSFSHA
ncbi:MAG: hypothetical protein ACD_60C00025G0093 [uncultured bacterium]|nr:MAG: hypothetical protein ACD_60C00025G0093 [uncultured bacterium]